MENEEIGGTNKKGNDKNRKQDNREDKPLREKDKPRNQKYLEQEKGKKVKVLDWEDELPCRWDWRHYQGIGNVLDQCKEAICWAISLIRVIEALLNIGKQLKDQVTLSIQHLRNNVTYGSKGILSDEVAHLYILSNGLLAEGECSYARSRTTCQHDDDNVERVTIDEIINLSNVDDTTLAEMVRRQPVVGILPLSDSLEAHRQGIYQRPKNLVVVPNSPTHAVVIVGFDIDQFGNAYWIIQSSWGEGWGEGGFGYVHRNTKKGQASMFARIWVPIKKDYPAQKEKKEKKK